MTNTSKISETISKVREDFRDAYRDLGMQRVCEKDRFTLEYIHGAALSVLEGLKYATIEAEIAMNKTYGGPMTFNEIAEQYKELNAIYTAQIEEWLDAEKSKADEPNLPDYIVQVQQYAAMGVAAMLGLIYKRDPDYELSLEVEEHHVEKFLPKTAIK